MTTETPHQLPTVREWPVGVWLRRLLLPLVLLALAVLAALALWTATTYDLQPPAASPKESPLPFRNLEP